MPWTRRERPDGLVEWTRSDDAATIRLRESADGDWVVRFDRLTQAPEGSTYRRETRPTRAAADELVAEWRDSFDVGDEGGNRGE